MSDILERIKGGLQWTSEIAKLELEITNLRRKLDDEAKKAGYKIYKKFKSEGAADPYLREVFAEMIKIEEELKEKEAKLKELKSGGKKEETPPPPPPPPPPPG